MNMRLRFSFLSATITIGVWLATPAWTATFFFSTGNADGRLGALSRPASPGKIETETADDFLLQQTTAITRATITGLIPAGTPLHNISEVEVVPHFSPGLGQSSFGECAQPNELALGCRNRLRHS